MIEKGIMIILAQMLIIFEYHNDKKTFYTIYEHHCLVHKIQTHGVMYHVERGKSVSLTVFRKERVKNSKIQ